MALADYMLCSVCGTKALYDANVQYEVHVRSGGLCDMAAICQKCAKTHSIKIVEKPTTSLVSRWLYGVDDGHILPSYPALETEQGGE